MTIISNPYKWALFWLILREKEREISSFLKSAQFSVLIAIMCQTCSIKVSLSEKHGYTKAPGFYFMEC